MIESIAAIIIAYLLGSVSSAIIVCKLMRLPDPRGEGSGNPGATNVLRIGGKKAAAITLLGDVLKGFIPVLLARIYSIDNNAIALVAFAAFLGHLFPIFFRFEGGKGVATLLGCLAALCWPVALAWLGTWFIVAFIFRYSSLAAIIATLLAPGYTWLVTQNIVYVDVILVMCFILIYRHRGNIIKLQKGTESKIGEKS